MPKLFEYLGIVIFFWSDEHEPIHVHGRYSDSEMKAEIILEMVKSKKLSTKILVVERDSINPKEMILKYLLIIIQKK